MVQVAGHEIGDAVGKLEGFGMAELEARREIKLGRLILNGFDDFLAAMTGVGTPKPRRRVEHLGAVRLEIGRVLGARQ